MTSQQLQTFLAENLNPVYWIDCGSTSHGTTRIMTFEVQDECYWIDPNDDESVPKSCESRDQGKSLCDQYFRETVASLFKVTE